MESDMPVTPNFQKLYIDAAAMLYFGLGYCGGGGQIFGHSIRHKALVFWILDIIEKSGSHIGIKRFRDVSLEPR